MYLSRLTFHTQPGKTRAVEQELRQLMAMVSQVGGLRARACVTTLPRPAPLM
jgi:hypothetical protein